MLGLEVYLNGESTHTVCLEPDITYIGRMAENHVVLDDLKASRSHARVIHNDGVYTLEDQDSENGVLVNGQKETRYKLAIGDQIQIGDYTLVVVDNDEAQKADRQEQLEDESSFNLNQTMNVNDPVAHQAMLDEMMKKKEKEQVSQQDADAPPKKNTQSPPTMKIHFTYGNGKVFEEEIVFDKGSIRPEEARDNNYLYVEVGLKKWKLRRKIEM